MAIKVGLPEEEFALLQHAGTHNVSEMFYKMSITEKLEDFIGDAIFLFAGYSRVGHDGKERPAWI